MAIESSVVIEIVFSVYNIPVKNAFQPNYLSDATNINKARYLSFVLLMEHSSLNCIEIGELFDIPADWVNEVVERVKMRINDTADVTWRNADWIEKYRDAKSTIISYMLVNMKENN